MPVLERLTAASVERLPDPHHKVSGRRVIQDLG